MNTQDKTKPDLAGPFSRIFTNLEEALWAFDFLGDALERLGVSSSDDKRFALTLRYNQQLMRLNFGHWAVLQFCAPDYSPYRVGIALLDKHVDLDDTGEQWDPFATKDNVLIRVYKLPIDMVQDPTPDLQEAYEKSFAYIAKQFKHWTASNYRKHNQPKIAEAVFDQRKRIQVLSEGIEVKKSANEPNIWWVNQGTTLADEKQEEFLWAPLKSKDGRSVYYWDLLDEVQEDDVIFHYSEGALRYVSQAQTDAVIAEKPHSSVVGNWEKEGRLVHTKYYELEPPILLDDIASDLLELEIDQGPLNQLGGVKQGYLFRLTPEALTLILNTHPEVDWPHFLHTFPIKPVHKSESSYFTSQTFGLLTQLHQTPTKDFYMVRKEEFQAHLEEPFKQLMHAVVAQLPPAITDVMETEKRLFARITKNDYGQGGAWDFYWGALYPKGSKRIGDAQLTLWISHEWLEFGFYIGAYGTEPRERFLRNCQKHYATLVRLLKRNFSDLHFVFGRQEDITIGADGSVNSMFDITWQAWLKDPEPTDFDVSIVLPPNEVLRYSKKELRDLITRTYKNLFPLVLLAIHDDPMPAIGSYLGFDEDDEDLRLNPAYSLHNCADATGFEHTELTQWVHAIERKKQAILYGPPGTGKTYLAQHLAKHLVGSSDGFWHLVQFHPAYAYEDFVQGIRPQPRANGGLDYPVVPGRFMKFCTKARQHEGPCVLIIDEINRANLARVFGELMYLLEYRDQEIPLAAGGTFSIPPNVRILGTMNTADRSIALVDHALRRRFAFIKLEPKYNVLRRYHQGTGYPVDALIEVLQSINAQIGNANYALGITFFLHNNLAEHIESIWQMEVTPYLEEYFFDQPDKIATYSWDKVRSRLLP